MPCIDCGNEVWREPFCRKCYSKIAMRKWRTGTATLAPKPTAEERFLSKVQVGGNDCWTWTGRLEDGYGQFHFQNRTVRAHRWAYEHWVNPIPDGMQIDHICRKPSCVNPEHLRLATPKANSAYRSAQVTECPHGHPYDDANTLVSSGRRHCRTCMRARAKAHNRKVFAIPDSVIENKAKTHCPAGHPYDSEHMRVYSGKRHCRTCATEAQRRYRAKQRSQPS